MIAGVSIRDVARFGFGSAGLGAAALDTCLIYGVFKYINRKKKDYGGWEGISKWKFTAKYLPANILLWGSALATVPASIATRRVANALLKGVRGNQAIGIAAFALHLFVAIKAGYGLYKPKIYVEKDKAWHIQKMRCRDEALFHGIHALLFFVR